MFGTGNLLKTYILVWTRKKFCGMGLGQVLNAMYIIIYYLKFDFLFVMEIVFHEFVPCILEWYLQWAKFLQRVRTK